MPAILAIIATAIALANATAIGIANANAVAIAIIIAAIIAIIVTTIATHTISITQEPMQEVSAKEPVQAFVGTLAQVVPRTAFLIPVCSCRCTDAAKARQRHSTTAAWRRHITTSVDYLLAQASNLSRQLPSAAHLLRLTFLTFLFERLCLLPYLSV